MNPIYQPRGKAREYGDYALNIYTGCPHRCYYCFAPNVLKRDREEFHNHVEPRKDIVEETRKQLEREHITGKRIHLCFTCDPYPTGYNTGTTREIIKLLKAYGNHVQILTKGDGSRDLDLLDENDWYGVTIDGGETPPKTHNDKITAIEQAHKKGIKTWISFEPVLNADEALWCIQNIARLVADKVKIGKLNYYPSDIDWKSFGERAEALCKELGLDYYIKNSLRKEMEKEEKKPPFRRLG